MLKHSPETCAWARVPVWGRENLHTAQNREKKKKKAFKCHYIHLNNTTWQVANPPPQPETTSPPKHISTDDYFPGCSHSRSMLTQTCPLSKPNFSLGRVPCKLNKPLPDSWCTLHKPHPTFLALWEGTPGGGEDPGHNRGDGSGQAWATPQGHGAGARPARPRIVTSFGGWDQLPTFIIFFFPPLKIKKRFMSWSGASKNE